MNRISEQEFSRICQGIHDDRAAIRRHNPIGGDDEILYWMLLNCLVSYLSLAETETPCFTGKPTAETYRSAILFVLRNRTDFDPEVYLAKLVTE